MYFTSKYEHGGKTEFNYPWRSLQETIQGSRGVRSRGVRSRGVRSRGVRSRSVRSPAQIELIVSSITIHRKNKKVVKVSKVVILVNKCLKVVAKHQNKNFTKQSSRDFEILRYNINVQD